MKDYDSDLDEVDARLTNWDQAISEYDNGMKNFLKLKRNSLSIFV